MYSKEQVELRDGIKFPGKSYQDGLLSKVFDVQKEYLYKPFISISKAHAVMLYEQNIITHEDVSKILSAICEVEKTDYSTAEYDPRYEDMFFMAEKSIENLIGPDFAGRLHIARSRNDIFIGECRIVLREKVIQVTEALGNFMKVIMTLAEENIDTVMPAYTHTQPAQPTTLAHYLMSMYDCLARSYERFLRLFDSINKNPLGAAAITTTGFPINRFRVAELLGFDGLVENSYDCIAGIDYLTEFAACLMILNTDMSRFIKDTLDFCTREFNVFYLSDPYVQTSSIMPQKRNPSSLEHMRPLISMAIAEAKVVFDVLHNTPYGDMVDGEEDLQPHLYESVNYSLRVFHIMSSVFATMEINKEILFNRAHEGFITVTELADVLVREKGLSFRQSHHVASGLVKHLIVNNQTEKDVTSEMVNEIAKKVLEKDIELSGELVKKALDPVNFVNIRKVTGGCSPVEVERMIKVRKEAFAQMSTTLNGFSEKIAVAYRALDSEVSKLINEK